MGEIAGIIPQRTYPPSQVHFPPLPTGVDDRCSSPPPQVQFLPLDPRETDSIDEILAQVDHALQYHDDVEPRDPDDEAGGDSGDEDDPGGYDGEHYEG